MAAMQRVTSGLHPIRAPEMARTLMDGALKNGVSTFCADELPRSVSANQGTCGGRSPGSQVAAFDRLPRLPQ